MLFSKVSIILYYTIGQNENVLDAQTRTCFVLYEIQTLVVSGRKFVLIQSDSLVVLHFERIPPYSFVESKLERSALH